MAYDNKERCKRYTLKKKLLDAGNKLFREWELKRMQKSSRSPREVKASIDAMLDLPRDWTETDYNNVKAKLSAFKNELYGEGDLDLQDDIAAVRKTAKDRDRATKTMKKAYTALVQTLELASGNPNDEAAVVLQMVRYVGRKLFKKGKIIRNDANAICLASLSNDYLKPKWVETYMQKLLEKNCNNMGFEK